MDGGARVDGKLFAISDIVCKLFSSFYAEESSFRDDFETVEGNGIFKL